MEKWQIKYLEITTGSRMKLCGPHKQLHWARMKQNTVGEGGIQFSYMQYEEIP
jgi:hypothetical protein